MTGQFRAGRFIQQMENYKAFIPEPLPPIPPLELDAEILKLLSKANLYLGQLNGLASIINDPDLFVYLYVRKEALLSSQIEGTQCSLEDVLVEGESNPKGNKNIEEVSNYVSAMNTGLARLKDLPVSSRLLKEMHAILLNNVRGSSKNPGEFRTSQNWIGHPGANLNNAEFVPPPPHEMHNCMGELEKYIHNDDGLPELIRAALIHAQFESIHPFLNGNGRLGRLLITFLLCSWGIIKKPLIYLSYFFKANRTEYYTKLMKVRLNGDWEGWIKFFLYGVAETAQMANSTAIEIHNIHKKDIEKIQMSKKFTPMMGRLFYIICRQPIINMSDLEQFIQESSIPTIQRAINRLVSLKILTEVSGKQRNRTYAYTEYLKILTRDTITQIG